MKFKYDCLNNYLWRIEPHNPEYSYQITEENQFKGNFGANGFILENNSWISFTVYEKKIKVFAKISQNEAVVYYRRDFIKSDLISFEFTSEDQVIKNEKGWWVKKPN